MKQGDLLTIQFPDCAPFVAQVMAHSKEEIVPEMFEEMLLVHIPSAEVDECFMRYSLPGDDDDWCSTEDEQMAKITPIGDQGSNVIRAALLKLAAEQ